MPGGARGELFALEQDAVGPADLGEVIERAHADDAARRSPLRGRGSAWISLFGSEVCFDRRHPPWRRRPCQYWRKTAIEASRNFQAAGLRFSLSNVVRRRCRATRAGRSNGARRSRSRPTTSSSSAPAATGWPPPITWRASTASPTSRCSTRAGSAAATPGATPRSSAPTICGTKARRSTSMR